MSEGLDQQALPLCELISVLCDGSTSTQQEGQQQPLCQLACCVGAGGGAHSLRGIASSGSGVRIKVRPQLLEGGSAHLHAGAHTHAHGAEGLLCAGECSGGG